LKLTMTKQAKSLATLPVRNSIRMRIASCLALAFTSALALTGCDLEEPLPDDGTADLLLEAEMESELELAPAETAPSIDELLEGSEAAALQTWLERQGYSMVSSDVELVSSDAASVSHHAVIQFAAPGNEDLIGAAIAFRLSPEGEVLEVAAVMADDADKADQDTCLAPLVYHASNDVVTTSITIPAQEAGCEVGIFGCGRCLTTGHCTLQSRQSYFWGIKFNTCDPCGGTNPNGCCGCLPGHPC
jgi:hypothetical protein